MSNCPYVNEEHSACDALSVAESRISTLEAMAVELGTLLSDLVDIEGPQPGSSDWAVKVKAALASPLLAELLGKEAKERADDPRLDERFDEAKEFGFFRNDEAGR